MKSKGRTSGWWGGWLISSTISTQTLERAAGCFEIDKNIIYYFFFNYKFLDAQVLFNRLLSALRLSLSILIFAICGSSNNHVACPKSVFNFGIISVSVSVRLSVYPSVTSIQFELSLQREHHQQTALSWSLLSRKIRSETSNFQ